MAGGLRRRLALEMSAQFENLLDLSAVQRRYPGRPIRKRLESAFGRETPERLACRHFAHRKLFGEGAQRHHFAGPKFSGKYRFLENRIGATVRRLGGGCPLTVASWRRGAPRIGSRGFFLRDGPSPGGFESRLSRVHSAVPLQCIRARTLCRGGAHAQVGGDTPMTSGTVAKPRPSSLRHSGHYLQRGNPAVAIDAIPYLAGCDDYL